VTKDNDCSSLCKGCYLDEKCEGELRSNHAIPQSRSWDGKGSLGFFPTNFHGFVRQLYVQIREKEIDFSAAESKRHFTSCGEAIFSNFERNQFYNLPAEFKVNGVNKDRKLEVSFVHQEMLWRGLSIVLRSSRVRFR
jgi:hypothetical protein